MINSFEQMPIGIFQKCVKISADESCEEWDRDVALLSIISGKEREELLSMPLVEFRTLMDKAGFLSGEPKSVAVQNFYDIGGRRYRPTLRVEQFTAGQFIDFQSYSANLIENLEKITSVFLVPEGCRYGEGYDLQELQEVLRDRFPVSDALALHGFFLECAKRSAIRSLSFLASRTKTIRARSPRELEAKTKTMEAIAALRNSLKNGGGPLR